MANTEKNNSRSFRLHRYVIIALICFLIVYGGRWVTGLRKEVIDVPLTDWRNFCQAVQAEGIDCVLIEDRQAVEVPEKNAKRVRKILEALLLKQK